MQVNIILLMLIILLLVANSILGFLMYLLFAKHVNITNKFMQRLKIKEFHEGDGK